MTSFTFQSRPSRSKYLMSMGAGSPRFTSSCLNTPARARVTMDWARSVPRTCTFQFARVGKLWSMSMAMLKASWPLELAADQISSWRLASARLMRPGRISLRSASKGPPSRKNEVSLVVMASTTWECRSPQARVRRRRTSSSSEPVHSRLASGSSREVTRYSLVSSP